MQLLEPRTLLSALTWSAGPSLPVARADAAAVSTYNGVLLLGGTVASGSASASLELDPFAATWNPVASLNGAHVSSGAGETGQPSPIVTGSDGGDPKYTTDIFVFGGASPTTGQPGSSMTSYDPANANNATPGPSMITPRSAFAYTTDPATGDLYAIGGKGTNGVVLSAAEVYDPHADAWSAIAPLPSAVYGAAAAPDGVGHLLVFGGDDTPAPPSIRSSVTRSRPASGTRCLQCPRPCRAPAPSTPLTG